MKWKDFKEVFNPTKREPPPEQPDKAWWIDDSKCKNCYECDAAFTMFNRRHHCRKCGKVFCSKCASNSIPASGKGGHMDAHVRVCNYCFRLYLEQPDSYSSGGRREQQQRAARAPQPKAAARRNMSVSRKLTASAVSLEPPSLKTDGALEQRSSGDEANAAGDPSSFDRSSGKATPHTSPRNGQLALHEDMHLQSESDAIDIVRKPSSPRDPDDIAVAGSFSHRTPSAMAQHRTSHGGSASRSLAERSSGLSSPRCIGDAESAHASCDAQHPHPHPHGPPPGSSSGRVDRPSSTYRSEDGSVDSRGGGGGGGGRLRYSSSSLGHLSVPSALRTVHAHPDGPFPSHPPTLTSEGSFAWTMPTLAITPRPPPPPLSETAGTGTLGGEAKAKAKGKREGKGEGKGKGEGEGRQDVLETKLHLYLRKLEEEFHALSREHEGSVLCTLLSRSNVRKAAVWGEVLARVIQEAASLVDPLLTPTGVGQDPRRYVKVKRVASGAPEASVCVPGLVFSKNVSHRRMPNDIRNPKVNTQAL